MPSVKAEFDGRVFVPCEEVRLPVGARVEVLLPKLPRKPTEEEDRQWHDVLRELAATEPHFPTVEEALAATRKRP